MIRRAGGRDSHVFWLEDMEYRKEFGSESAKLEIAAAIVRARELANMTQLALAELMGTSQAHIAKLERGDANPTIGNIGRLFACMQLKAAIEPTLMEPTTFGDSGLAQAQDYPEPNADDSGVYAHTAQPYPNSGSSSSSSDAAPFERAIAGPRAAASRRGRRRMSAS